jgi:hypothetical protein
MIAPIVAALWFLCFEAPAAQFEIHPIFNTLVIGVFSFTSALLFFGVWKQDEGEAIGGFFSETNWNSDKKIKR